MMVSVVIIGRNEGARLERCIQSVQSMCQDGFSIELIYVDSQSTDNSIEVAASYGATCLELSSGQMTAARARNAGWRAARGEFVLFLDGDTVVAPKFVCKALPHFRLPDVAVVWGNRREIDVRSLYNRVLDLDWANEAGWTKVCGGDSLMRRTALDTVGGFDSTLIAGEEPELCQRLGAFEWRIYHVDELMTMHDLSIKTFRQYWKRSVRTGFAYSEVSQRCRWMGRPFWVAELTRARTHVVLFVLLPLLTLAASFMMHTWMPVAMAVLVAGLMIARSAWRARWRSRSPITLVAYALHSQFQHVPIFIGHRRYRRTERAGVRGGLIEYK